MNLDRLDKIVLSEDDVVTILDWDKENHHRFDSVDFPMLEGVMVTSNYIDLLKRELHTGVHFKFDEDSMVLKIYEWESKNLIASFNTNYDSINNQELSNAKHFIHLLMATFQYMNNNVHTVTERKITKNHTKKSNRKKSAKKGNRIVKMSSVQYTFNHYATTDKRTYERHIESWRVKGHWRHYKSGKIIWVEQHTKGIGDVAPKTYKV